MVDSRFWAAPPLTAHEKWRRLLNMLEWTATHPEEEQEEQSTKLVEIYAPAMRFKLCHLMCDQSGDSSGMGMGLKVVKRSAATTNAH